MNAAVSRAPASATAAAAISAVCRPRVKTRSTPLELDWVRHAPPASRAVRLTDAGRRGLAATFGLSLDDAPPRVRAGGATASRSRSE
jgi:hypothetical protein